MDPFSLIIVFLFHMGNRFLKINLTKAQENLVAHPIAQVAMYFCIIYYSTKNIYHTIAIVSIAYVVLNVLFNENHKYNMLSEKWLVEQNIRETNKEYKENYKNMLHTIHN